MLIVLIVILAIGAIGLGAWSGVDRHRNAYRRRVVPSA